MNPNIANRSGPQGMRYSRIQEHNIYRDTDKLYDPLRGVILHPQTSVRHSQFAMQAQRSSLLRDQYHTLSPQEAARIRETTLIPSDVQLYPTHHIEKVRGSRMKQIDARQTYGNPISQQQFQRISQNPRHEQIVYEFGEDRQHHQERRVQYIAAPLTYNKQKSDYKYNLFSVIDEPIARLMSGAKCGFPGNQCIASEGTNNKGWL